MILYLCWGTVVLELCADVFAKFVPFILPIIISKATISFTSSKFFQEIIVFCFGFLSIDLLKSFSIKKLVIFFDY